MTEPKSVTNLLSHLVKLSLRKAGFNPQSLKVGRIRQFIISSLQRVGIPDDVISKLFSAEAMSSFLRNKTLTIKPNSLIPLVLFCRQHVQGTGDLLSSALKTYHRTTRSKAIELMLMSRTDYTGFVFKTENKRFFIIDSLDNTQKKAVNFFLIGLIVPPTPPFDLESIFSPCDPNVVVVVDQNFNIQVRFPPSTSSCERSTMYTAVSKCNSYTCLTGNGQSLVSYPFRLSPLNSCLGDVAHDDCADEVQVPVEASTPSSLDCNTLVKCGVSLPDVPPDMISPHLSLLHI